jgi:hypothetical protein
MEVREWTAVLQEARIIFIMSDGLWVMGYGLWVMGYGLWVMGYGLWVKYKFLKFIFNIRHFHLF